MEVEEEIHISVMKQNQRKSIKKIHQSSHHYRPSRSVCVRSNAIAHHCICHSYSCSPCHSRSLNSLGISAFLLLRYSANGVQFYLVSLASYLLLVYLLPDLPIQIYKNFPEIISSLNIFSLLFCVGLLIKGYFRPEVEIVNPERRVYLLNL